jgi:hypothetical protein
MLTCRFFLPPVCLIFLGFPIPPEGPHSVKNLSNIEILAYRVEFKN